MSNPIEEKFLGRGDLFGLRFDEGLVPISVDSWTETGYKPYDGVGSIGTQTNSGTQRLEDTDGEDILFIEKGADEVYHVSIGHMPSSVRRYTEYPENGPTLGSLQNLTSPSASNGDNYAHTDGTDSPYDNPTDYRELFIPPGFHLGFDFYNPNKNDSVKPKLNIKLRRYKVRFIDFESNKGEQLVKRIVNPGSPIPVADVGSIDSQQSVSDTNWNVDPISDRQLNSIIG